MSAKKTDLKQPKKSVKETPTMEFVFKKQNYIIMLAGLLVIIIGFTLMYGKEDIYDFRKITLAPIVVLTGFVIEVFAILYKPKE